MNVDLINDNEEDWSDVTAHYEYLLEHKKILKRLDMKE